MSSSPPKKTGAWTATEDRSLLLQVFHLASTGSVIKHQSITVDGRTPRAVMERFNALKKVAAEEVRGGSTSSMSSAAANPTNAANAAPRSASGNGFQQGNPGNASSVASPRPKTTPKSTTRKGKLPASKKRKRDIFSEEESEAYSVHSETEDSNQETGTSRRG